MPFYEYRCRACGHVYEEFVRSFFGKAAPVCPRCGSQDAEKVVSKLGSAGRSSESRSSGANCAPTGG